MEVSLTGSEDEEQQQKGESRGKMIQRHKREVKLACGTQSKQELEKKIAQLLHAVPRNDKKKKTEVQEQIKKMEMELKQRHEKELADFEQQQQQKDNNADGVAETALPATAAKSGPRKGPGKAQQKKAAKAKTEQERQRKIAEEKANTVSQREVEMQKINQALRGLGLGIKEIPADGHCLYAALADQLVLSGLPPTSPLATVQGLRWAAAEHLRRHKEEFAPFVLVQDIAGPGTSDADLYARYCDRVASSADWGGQIELRALANELQRRIIVHSADGPDIVMGDEFHSEPALRVSFHRHYYTLGEHYNSVVPLSELESEADQ